MAVTTTYITADITASAQFVTLNAYTAPGGRAKPLLRLNDEICLITNTVNAPTLGIVRGYMGTSAVAHKSNEPASYGTPDDMQASKGPSQAFASFSNPYLLQNTAEMTATGATGTTAAPVTAEAPAFLNCTGTSGAGINLLYPTAGQQYVIRNATTGVLKVYSVGATINGTTGTTAVSVTATGNLTALATCSTAGAWYVVLNT